MTDASQAATKSSRKGRDRPDRRGAGLVRRVGVPLTVVAGALLWWPVGFLGQESWLHLPLVVFDGDVVFLGATAAAASVSLVVRSPWPRFAIIVVSSALGWVLDGPTTEAYPYERAVLAILLGARGTKGPLAAATVLAVVAGLSPTTWPSGLALALALALPFAVATWQRVAPTVLSLVRLVLTWLVLALGARALSYVWDLVRPGSGDVPVGRQARTVGDASWDFARTQWWTYSEAVLASSARWFVTAAVLAVVIVVLRAGRSGLRRRTPAS